LPDATDELAGQLLVDRAWLQEQIELLRDRRQLIFYGPPSTGKTYLAQAIAAHLTDSDAIKLVQFHPAYSYEDFFEGFRPVSSADGSGVGFKLSPGPFRRLVDAARENPGTAYVLIIDEINRANLAKVFGELYFLLENRGHAIDLLYSAGDEAAFTLPRNVYLIGTMNTADRSIALVDTAMRRRFAFTALHPSEEPTSGVLGRWLAAEGHSQVCAQVLGALNALIEDEDFKIGPSYFMRASAQTETGLQRVWRSSILPLLEEQHYGESLDVNRRYDLARILRSIGTAESEPVEVDSDEDIPSNPKQEPDEVI
jgi:5-methylcytosine-specific restriction protein B